jgi:hypothetical protein
MERKTEEKEDEGGSKEDERTGKRERERGKGRERGCEDKEIEVEGRKGGRD